MLKPDRLTGLALIGGCIFAIMAALPAGADSALDQYPRALEGPIQVGEEIRHSVDTSHPYGSGFAPEEGVEITQHTLHHPGAAYIAIHFSRFELAEGDHVVVRSPDGSRSRRYEGLGKSELGGKEGFWAMHMPGDTAIVELHRSSASGAYGYSIDRYARGFQAWEMKTAEAKAPCGPDDTLEAKCYQTGEPDIYDKSRAVARLLIQGSSLCTGWLVGCEGHVMTNQHCIGSAYAAANTDFEFMAEGATCSQDCRQQLGCPGTVVADTSTLVQLSSIWDYTLVLLPRNPTPTYGYLQLRPSGALLEERAYSPQHPAGWGKRIAVASTHPQNPSGFAEIDSLTEPACSGGPAPDVGYYLDTRGGSSGSPVLAYSDHRVVALHHCRGQALYCGDPNRGVPIQEVIADLGANLPDCAVSECGNNILEPGEVCDGTDLGGETCQSLGFDGGILGCANDCSGFVTRHCFDCHSGPAKGEWNLPLPLGTRPGFVKGELYVTNGGLAYPFEGTLKATSQVEGVLEGSLLDLNSPTFPLRAIYQVSGTYTITDDGYAGHFSAEIFPISPQRLESVGKITGKFLDVIDPQKVGEFEADWQICD